MATLIRRPPMTARAPRSMARVCAALALIVLVLVGRVAESIHAAEADHVVCTLHGETLHVADHHAQSAHEAPLGVRVLPVAVELEHEHCLLATLLWSCASAWTPDADFAAALDALICVASATCAGERRALAPLCFAPKHSPPYFSA